MSAQLEAVIDHSYNRDLLPLPIVIRSNIQMHQKAGKIFLFIIFKIFWEKDLIFFSSIGGIITFSSNGNRGNGTNNNTFAYSDQAGNTFNRVADAAFNRITFDQQSGTLAPIQVAAAKEAQPSTAPFLDNVFGSARLPGGRQMGVELGIDI